MELMEEIEKIKRQILEGHLSYGEYQRLTALRQSLEYQLFVEETGMEF
jgi:hypothetical protein